MTFLNPLPPQSWTISINPFRAHLGYQQTTQSVKEHKPAREVKDSAYEPSREAKEYIHPTRGDKDSVCTVSQGSYIYPRKCKRPPSKGQTKVVCDSVGRTRRSPLPTGPSQTRLSSTIQGTSQTVQATLHTQRIQLCRQRQCLINIYSGSPRKKLP